MSFSSEDLEDPGGAEEVEIETQAPGGPAHRTTIWIVVDDGEAFVRTVQGPRRPLVPRGHGEPRRRDPRRTGSASPATAIPADRPRFDRARQRRLPPQVRRRSRQRRDGRRTQPRRRRSASSPPDPTRVTVMYFDEFKHQLPDIDPEETSEWLGVVRPARRAGGREPGAVPRLQAAQAGPPAPRRAAAADPDPLHQHDQPRAGAVLPGRRADRAPDPPDHPLERGRDGPPREQPVQRASAATSRPTPRAASLYEVGFNHFFRGKDDGQRRRPDLLPGPRRAGHLRPGVPRGPPDRGPARPLPARDGAGRGPAVVPASAAHAGLLGVPDGLDGHRPDQRDLPGPLQPLPPEPRPARHVRVARLGVPRRRRDRRARDARGAPRRRPRGPRQPDVRRQLQPPAPRRPGPRQRQDHPGARVRVPRRRLERDQGHLGAASGTSSSPATSTASSSRR